MGYICGIRGPLSSFYAPYTGPLYSYGLKSLHAGSIEEPATIVPTSCGHRGRELQMQDVWWLDCSLGNAADTVNEVYSTQLLLWIATMWINALSRIYAMNETLAGTDQVLLKLREGMLVTACIGNLMIITGVCHFTAFEVRTISSQMRVSSQLILIKICDVEYI